MTYPLRQRTFHEFFNYLHNVRVHCCARRAVKHYRMSLIKKIKYRLLSNAIWAVNHRERIHLPSSGVLWHFLQALSPPLSSPLPSPPLPSTFLFLFWMCVRLCLSVSLQNHTGFSKLTCCISHKVAGVFPALWLRLMPVKMKGSALFY